MRDWPYLTSSSGIDKPSSMLLLVSQVPITREKHTGIFFSSDNLCYQTVILEPAKARKCKTYIVAIYLKYS